MKKLVTQIPSKLQRAGRGTRPAAAQLGVTKWGLTHARQCSSMLWGADAFNRNRDVSRLVALISVLTCDKACCYSGGYR